MSTGVRGEGQERTEERRHNWKRLASGAVDEWAIDGDQHNGPRCLDCCESFCSSCEPKRWEAVLDGTDPADCTGPLVRSWRLPAEPGPEVTRLSSRGGDVLLERHVDDSRYWVPRSVTTGTEWSVLLWPDAFHQWQPLTDATPPPGGEEK